MKRKGIRYRLYRGLITFLLIESLCAPAWAGTPTIPGLYSGYTAPQVNALPVPKAGGTFEGTLTKDDSINKLTINQNKEKAVYDWDSFNIGEQAWTHFDQKGNKEWVALNRIYDANPSMIFGKLTADGKVYLINQNGFLFGPSSRVNVHSLIASSLNITTNDFLKDTLNFKAGEYNGLTDTIDTSKANLSAVISNQGVIETDDLGQVFLIAPTVENNGIISSPVGQVGLIAGGSVELIPDTSGNRPGLVVTVNSDPGEAYNREQGFIVADMGIAGLYGRVVNQDGIIRSVSALKKNGRIELFASDKVATGPKSITACLVSDSAETEDQSFQFKPGIINILGLNPTNPDPQDLSSEGVGWVGTIEHSGLLLAPSGTIRLAGKQRVYLDGGSAIDVSGAWLTMSGDANLISVRLNSVQLRDYYAQKDGILQGKDVQVSSLFGSTIGDISGSLNAQQQTALEQASLGGRIEIHAPEGDIILRDGGRISFAGGGISYGEGQYETTKLLAGNRVYDISEADPLTHYEKVLGLQQTYHERYGITEEYKGLYYGGASALNDFVGPHVEGSDAGKLLLSAKRIVLDGTLDGSVGQGIYQTMKDEPENQQGNQTQAGRKEPNAGALYVGVGSGGYGADRLIQEVVIQKETTPLPDGFGAADIIPAEMGGPDKTFLSAQTLNAAGLGSIDIRSDTRLAIEKEVQLSLAAGGSFSGSARQIVHSGALTVPGGKVDLRLAQTMTSEKDADGNPNPGYVPVEERIYLAEGSLISAAGQRIDNSSVATGAELQLGQVDGGVISLKDETHLSYAFTTEARTQGVVMMPGAVLDVSGGWEIGPSGKVKGGNAGTLELQGSSLVLAGGMRGHALFDKTGGNLVLHANTVSVGPDGLATFTNNMGPDTPLAEELKGRLSMDWNVTDRGFTSIEVRSEHDIEIDPAMALTPSGTRLSTPVSNQGRGPVGPVLNAQWQGGGSSANGFSRVNLDEIGQSGIIMKAGQLFETSQQPKDDSAKLTVGQGALLQVAPGGEIGLSAPAIEMAGILKAPAGTVTLNATVSDLHLAAGAQILAMGYNKPEMTVLRAGQTKGYSALPGGSVTLSSKRDLLLDPASLIDVSGSEPVRYYVEDDKGGVVPFAVAGDPGSLALTYERNLSLGGMVDGRKKMEGLRGGSLSLTKTSLVDPLVVKTQDMTEYQAAGFDSLTLRSYSGLTIEGGFELSVARALTLDAPVILGLGNKNISLSAPWITLANTYTGAGSIGQIPGAAAGGDAVLTLNGDWIDLNGSFVLSGFGEANMTALNHIRASDLFYEGKTWEGMLNTAGDLILGADAIYPTTLSRFTFRSGGKISVLPGDDPTPGPIPSAGGTLTLEAKRGIEHRGFLTAPLGSVTLEGTDADSRIYLAEGSTISTSGQMPVLFGVLDSNTWKSWDKSGNVLEDVLNAPDKSVEINAGEVIARPGSRIDVSGGGGIFNYQFMAGAEGSENPLTKAGRYVILPDHSIVLPGEAVYLEGAEGVSAGTYSLLPAEYAFLPGAMIIEERSGDLTSADQRFSAEGFRIVSGYSTVTGTNEIRSPRPKGYVVRKAEDVLKEGHFDTWSKEGGNAGSIKIVGSTTVLEGTMTVKAEEGYKGGTISLSGKEVAFGQSGGALPDGFSFKDAVPASLKNRLNVNASTFEGMDLEEISLGDLASTDKVTIEEGSVLEAARITLNAEKEILLRAGAEIRAISESSRGVASLLVPGGKLTLQSGSLVHASDKVVLSLSDIDLSGDIQVDHSSISLEGTKIFLVPDLYVQTDPGLYLTPTRWKGLSIFEDITLKSASDVLFRGDFALSAAESLTIDAARIAADPLSPGGANNWTVALNAPTISLLNTGASSTAADSGNDTGTLTLNASNISVGHGSIRFDGFSALNFNSSGDVVFKGAGGLNTGGAGLNITAPRVTTSFYQDAKTSYEVANFKIDAGSKAVTTSRGSGSTGQSKTPGGSLEIDASTIDIANLVEVNSGRIKLTATGTKTAVGAGPDGTNIDGVGIVLRDGAELNAEGSGYAPGGMVDLSADPGKVVLAAGSTINVSAGAQGDAGAVSLYAPSGGVLLNGALKGHASDDPYGNPGLGGSFSMDTLGISDFNSLNENLSQGGFNNQIALRARTGNVELGSSTAGDPGITVKAHGLKLTADSGDLLVRSNATIDAAGESGGDVELLVKNNLKIWGNISAKATGNGEMGGEIFLSAAQKDGTGQVYLYGSTLDVSGGPGGQGGTVYFRVNSGKNTNAGDIAGTVVGASQVLAETVNYYEKSGNIGGMFTFPSPGNFQHNLSLGSAQYKKLTGIEIWSQAGVDLTLNQGWDLTSKRDSSGNPGVLTIRSGGNLNINANLVDHPTSNDNRAPAPDLAHVRDSWGLRLSAGADLTSADPLAVKPGVGDMTLGPGVLVYTESAPIQFASGRNTTMGPGSSTSYMTFEANKKIRHNLGTYDGDISGQVGGNLRIVAGAIQSALGNIDFSVGGDLLLEKALDFGSTNTYSVGAVRTTGDSPIAPSGRSNYWQFTNGGDIRLQVTGLMTVSSGTMGFLDVPDPEWDAYYPATRPGNWAASYKDLDATTGVAAMGGGNVEIRTGKDFVAKAGTFQKGNLRVFSGGLLNGRFVNRQGDTLLSAMGAFGNPPSSGALVFDAKGVLEVFDTRLVLAAQGDIYLGALVSPTLVNESTYNVNKWLPGYTQETSAKLVSATGDVWMYGDSPYHTPTDARRERLLPPSLEIEAGRDIQIRGDSYVLLPSSTGELSLTAGRDITGGSKGSSSYGPKLLLSDYDIQKTYNDSTDPAGKLENLFNSQIHAGQPVHINDPDPVLIHAGRDISYLEIYLSKRAEITADGNISDIFYQGQNVSSEDITRILAGKDIRLSDSGSASFTGFSHAGPGTLIVQAGGTIDLGTTRGIETIGSGLNPALGSEGSRLILGAGIERELQVGDVKSFFEGLRTAGEEFSASLADADQSAAQARVAQARAELVEPFLAGSEGKKGDLLMLNSQVSTKWGDDDLFVIATGKIDVGRTVFASEEFRKNTGIYTAGGGAINIFATGDVNVNESRVMTFRGGDITLWSDRGGINAGRGSKTTVSAEPPQLVDKGGGVKEYVFTPPAVGSGIRALTFDPDGVAGPLKAPPAGDIYLFAPEGTIDAGEAGIAGKTIVLGATQVLNAQNISFTAGSVGIPISSQGTANLGALSGAGALAQTGSMAEQTTNLASEKADSAREAAKLAEEFLARWVDVRVLSFYEIEIGSGQD